MQRALARITVRYMYYHLLCTQNHNIMASGSNSKTKKELKEGLLSYIRTDEVDWKRIKKMSVEDICKMWEFEIVKTKNKVKINY